VVEEVALAAPVVEEVALAAPVVEEVALAAPVVEEVALATVSRPSRPQPSAFAVRRTISVSRSGLVAMLSRTWPDRPGW
jgi:hypothetical protein